jgi:1,4-alpha-glucan branching enzyme
VDGSIRVNTGLKYYRITGQDEKKVYCPAQARERAAEHAGHFLAARQEQVQRLRHEMDRPPVAVAPYDAELFGHWWYEGPIFLDMLFRKMHFDQNILGSITPALTLQAMPTNQQTTPAASSWGHEGSYEFWMDECNEWIYPHLHQAADRYSDLVVAHGSHPSHSLMGRALKQAGRELLLAQGSDWPFIIRTGTSPDYATQRIKDHLARFQHICGMLTNESVDETTLAGIEEISPLFPTLDPQNFAKNLSETVLTTP